MNRRQAKKIVRNHTARGWGKAWSIWMRTVRSGVERRTGRWSPGDPDWRRRARAAVSPGPVRLWWLSFCDGTDGHFLGACQVPATHYMQAIQVAHSLGCNPGGEVKGIEVQDVLAPLIESKYIGVLMDKAACEIFDALLGEKIRDAGLQSVGGRAHLQTRSTPQSGTRRGSQRGRA